MGARISYSFPTSYPYGWHQNFIERVVVVASTNIVNAIDPTLRRRGCFDFENEFSAPNEEERFEILQLYALAKQFDDGCGHGPIQILT